MKFLFCLFCAAAAQGADVGDTYEQVIAEKGAPKGEIRAGDLRVLSYGDAVVRIRDGAVVSIRPVAKEASPRGAPAPASAAPAAPLEKAAEPKKAMLDAMMRVRSIVNQPAAPVARTPEMKVELFGPPWFQAGEATPDFDTVDVRRTQERPYDPYPHVSSELNPDVAWVGSDLEFNAMTKFFYTDRSVPKKKLTESEMLEINRLYRVIGQCARELAASGSK